MKKLLAQSMRTCVCIFVLGAVGSAFAQSPEDVRTELLNLTDSIHEISALGPQGVVNSASLQKARLQIQQMSDKDLTVLGSSIDPTTFSRRLLRARSVVSEYSQGAGATRVAHALDTTPFPVANGECTSANGNDVNRIPTSVVLAADVVYFVAEGVKEAAKDACDQVAVVVALGEGGGANTSLLCLASDAIYVVAHAVNEGIHFCDDDLTGAVIDASYARLGDIHSDVNSMDTDVTTGFTSLGTQVSNSNAQIAGEFSALDTHISGLIAALSTQLTKDTIPTSGTTCNGIYGGIFPGNLTISAGQNCVIVSGGVTGQVLLNGGTLTMSNAQVGGSVQVVGGGTFSLGPGLTIGQDLNISSLPKGTGTNRVCGTMVQGTVQFQNNASAVLIGSPSTSPACPGNMVGRDLMVSANYAATTVDGNTVGGNLLDQNNNAATKVFSNVVGNDLQCQNNTSITGSGNKAKLKQGQCAAF